MIGAQKTCATCATPTSSIAPTHAGKRAVTKIEMPVSDVNSAPLTGIFINDQWRAVLLSLVTSAEKAWLWANENDLDRIEQNAYRLYEAILNPQTCPEVRMHNIGEVFMSAAQDVPTGCLPCDGGTYQAVDYAALYTAIDASLKDANGTTFRTPKLIDGRVPAGTGQWSNSMFDYSVSFDVGDEAGDFDHTLTVNQIPAHTHTVQTSGSTSGGSNAIYAPTNRLPQGSVVSSPAGDSQPHSNVQPITGVKFFIQAE